MSDGTKSLVVAALPHPVSRAAFAYLDSMIRVLGRSARWTGRLVTDPDRGDLAGDHVVYLRPQAALDALPLLRVVGHPAPMRTVRSHALADRCDARWRHHPVLAIEAVMNRESHALAFLSEALSLPVDAEARSVAATGFIDLRRSEVLWGNPAAFLSTLELLDEGEAAGEDPPRRRGVLMIGGEVAPNYSDGADGHVVRLGLAEAIDRAQADAPADEGCGTVMLVDVAGSDLPVRLLPWLIAQAAPNGTLCGREGRESDVEAVLGALTRHGVEDGLTFVVQGVDWTAHPRNYRVDPHVG